MAVGYRAILRLQPGQDAILLAEEQLHSWLRSKGRGRNASLERTDWEGPGVYRLGARSALHVVHEQPAEDGSVRRLYRMVETNEGGDWAVSIYAASRPLARKHPQTLVVEVDRRDVDQATAIQTADPPRIAQALLDSAIASDGATRLTGAPTVVRAGGTSELLDAISDQERTASVIVAASLGPDLDDPWRQVVANLTRQSVGVAATYVVYADAVDELNAALPPSHRVTAGKVRTFLPHVDFTDPNDSTRHKWLGPATLTRSLTGQNKVATPLQRRHAEIARRRLVESELPSDVRRTIDLLRRAETGVQRAARVADLMAVQRAADIEPSAAKETSLLARDTPGTLASSPRPTGSLKSGWVEEGRRLVRSWLRDVTEPRLEDLRRLDAFVKSKVAEVEVAEDQLLEAAEREEQLETEVQALRGRLDDMELDLAVAEEEEIERQREVTELRYRLVELGSAETYVAPVDQEWESPESVEELVRRLTPGTDSHRAHSLVEFTGNEDAAIEIDRRYPSGLYARTLWQYVRVLYDFAEARQAGFSGGVHMYLADERVAGAKCSTTRHAATESDSVLANNAWRHERILPVPESVDPSGTALMAAHFKPTHRDTFAPRMHYLDDTGKSGKIYIGYIGRHLSNKKT